MHSLYDVLETWRERASDVRGKSLPGGHWLPRALLAELLAFLLQGADGEEAEAGAYRPA